MCTETVYAYPSVTKLTTDNRVNEHRLLRLALVIVVTLTLPDI